MTAKAASLEATENIAPSWCWGRGLVRKVHAAFIVEVLFGQKIRLYCDILELLQGYHRHACEEVCQFDHHPTEQMATIQRF